MIGDFDSSLILGHVQLSLANEACGRGRIANEVEQGVIIDQRLSHPVGADETKHAVFDRIPLGSTSGKVVDGDGQPELIGERLETDFPEPSPPSIGATRVSFNEQVSLL